MLDMFTHYSYTELGVTEVVQHVVSLTKVC